MISYHRSDVGCRLAVCRRNPGSQIPAWRPKEFDGFFRFPAGLFEWSVFWVWCSVYRPNFLFLISNFNVLFFLRENRPINWTPHWKNTSLKKTCWILNFWIFMKKLILFLDPGGTGDQVFNFFSHKNPLFFFFLFHTRSITQSNSNDILRHSSENAAFSLP